MLLNSPTHSTKHNKAARRVALGFTLGFVTLITAAGCTPTASEPTETQTSIVVSTNILTDIVTNIVGDEAKVTGLMTAGTDPHSFQISAQQALLLEQADLIVYNGLGLEAGLLHNIEAAVESGVIGIAVAEQVNPIAFVTGSPEHSHEAEDDDHADHNHAEEDHAHDEHDHEHAHDNAVHQHDHDVDGLDPHFWNDPHRMMTAVEIISEEIIAHVEGIDTEVVQNNTQAYLNELESLDEYLHHEFETIPEEHRKLVTNHAVFGYLANAYHFEVIGTVIPGGATLAEPSSAELNELVNVIEKTGVPAIFVETSQPTRLAEVLAAEVDHDVQVVSLYSESLGEPGSDADTYLNLMRYNTEQIVQALR